MLFLNRVMALVAVVSLTFACGGKVDTVTDAGGDAPIIPPPNDAHPPPPPPDDATLPPGQCNAVPQEAAVITLSQVPSNPPSFPPAGSLPAFGIYVLDSFTAYTGPNGQSGSLGDGQVTLQLSKQGAINSFIIDVNALIGNGAPQTSSATGTVTGVADLTITPFCPSPASSTPSTFSFDGKTFLLRTISSGMTIDESYVLVN